MPLPSAPSLSTITQGLPSSASSLVSQGQSIFSQADALSNGDYSGLAVAASGLIADIPPGAIHNALAELTSAGEGALAGAAIGSIIPGWGTAIGAIVGAIVGLVEGMVGQPPVVEGDIRPTAEQWLFPATANQAAYSVTPYNFIHPRVLPLPFYQLASGPIQAWSPLFNFGVTWTRPPSIPGVTRPSKDSQQAAWALCQWHAGVDAISKAYCFKSGAHADWAEQIQQSRLLAGTLLGGDDIALKAFNVLSAMYGAPGSFSSSWNMSAAPNAVLYGLDPPAQLLVMSNGGPNTAAIMAALKASYGMPLDWTYYARGAQWDQSSGSLIRTAPSSWNVLAYFGDTIRLTLAECAVLGYSAQSVMHMLLGMLWMNKRGNMYDAVQWGAPFMPIHQNLARVLGIVSNIVRKNTPKQHHSIGKVKGALDPRQGLTHRGKVGYTVTNSDSLVTDGAIVGAGGLGIWGLSHLIRR